MLFKQNINPEYDTFIYHICSVGTNKANYGDATIGNRIDLLVGHLLKFYEPTHEVYLCQSEEVRQAGDFKHRVNLSDLGSVLEHINFSTSLFVPAVQPKAIDEDFLALLRD